MEETLLIGRIEDQGIGIPQAEKTRVFQNFQRASNVAQIQGTGLGLPLVKQSVTAINGTIDLISETDRDTTVIVTLPNELSHHHQSNEENPDH